MPVASDSTTDGPGKDRATTVSYHRIATANWADTEAPNATSLIEDTTTAERNEVDILGGTTEAPSADFVDDIPVALQVKRFADGALNELEVTCMVSEINEGQNPYIVAAKNNVSLEEMTKAITKFAAEKLEKAESAPKVVTVLVVGEGRYEVSQDGQLCKDAEEMLREVGLKPVDDFALLDDATLDDALPF